MASSHPGETLIERVFAHPLACNGHYHVAHYRERAVAIPEFSGEGLLPVPYGPPLDDYNGVPIYAGHPSTLDEIYDRFVRHYPESTIRAAMWTELDALVHLAAELFPTLTIVVAGQFVMDVPNPDDLLVALWVLDELVSKLEPTNLWLVNRVFNSRQEPVTDDSHATVDTEFCRHWPEGHVRHDEGRKQLRHVCYMACRPGARANPVGYLEILLDSEGGVDAEAEARD